MRIAIVFIAVYAAPFLLTNSDPRFRIPFDAVYALSAFLYLAQPRHSRIAAASGRVSKRLSPANAGAAQASRSAARPSGAAAKASGA